MTTLTDYEREQRLECLKIAASLDLGCETVSRARDFYAFVSGETQVLGPPSEGHIHETPSALARIASSTDAILELLNRCASGDYLSITGDSAVPIYTPPSNPEASDRD